jgi:alpha-L-rhamnosidase
MTGEVGWLVRAPTASSGYLFYLDADNDTEGAPNTLQEVALGPSEYSTIADVELPSPITPGSWHRIRTVVSGQEITTSIDGRQAARIDMGSLPPGASVYGAGTVGFVVPGTEASFRDLRVTSPEGTTLYASSFSQSSALNDFVGGEVASPDLLPVIMDGAKRDRVVWSGDLGVEGPNVFDTTAADRYVRDSLQLLGSYQSAGGESAGDVPPTVPLGTFPESGYPYSASYSMDEVTNIATYYLYTGDLGFVRTEWPMITREISYENSLVDQRGLLSTDATDGMDWDYYDGARGGEVTAYNDIFYETLEDAATMAQALGLSGQATTYRKEATSLRSSINRYLFDPSTGLYPVSDRQPGTVAQDANSLAVLFGVVTGARASAVTMSLERALPSTPYGPLPFSANTGYVAAVSPFVTNEELQALFATGQTHAALSLMERLWGYMDRPGPDYTAADWETIGTSGAPQFGGFTSLAHGWSSGATADLSTYVLGVEPVGAGYRQWLVQPHPGSLSWVEGDVPTPGGNISVRWAQDGTTRRFALQVAAPVATRGTISVPVPSSGAIVTIHRSVHQGSSPSTHSIRTALGATYLAVPASGGQTYVVDVQPR